MHTKRQTTKFWNTKILQYGKYIEVCQYEKIFKENFARIKKEFKTPKNKTSLTKRQIFSIKRSQKAVKMLIEQNFTNTKYVSFLTLTFKDHVTDPRIANRYFRIFCRRLRALDNNLRYLAVLEFQKSGRAHYHVGLSTVRLSSETMCRMWPYGFWDLHALKSVHSVGCYLTKYMQKGVMDSRLCGVKAYQCSRNLVRPLIYKLIGTFKDQLSRSLFPNLVEVYNSESLTAWAGRARIWLYRGTNYLNMQNYASELCGSVL